METESESQTILKTPTRLPQETEVQARCARSGQILNQLLPNLYNYQTSRTGSKLTFNRTRPGSPSDSSHPAKVAAAQA